MERQQLLRDDQNELVEPDLRRNLGEETVGLRPGDMQTVRKQHLEFRRGAPDLCIADEAVLDVAKIAETEQAAEADYRDAGCVSRANRLNQPMIAKNGSKNKDDKTRSRTHVGYGHVSFEQ